MKTRRIAGTGALLVATLFALASGGRAEDGVSADPADGVVMVRKAADGGVETAAPGPTSAFHGSGWQPYLVVRWATPGGKVEGKITGGVPSVEWDLDLPNRARRDLHQAGTYRVLLPVRAGHAGEFRVAGRLVTAGGAEKVFEFHRGRSFAPRSGCGK
jgi:hypothetical protein